MATNCYHYEERWSFDPKNPTAYFGWGITTSSSNHLRIAHFSAPGLRDQMANEAEEILKKHVTPEQLANIDSELVAALFLIMRGSGSEDDDQFASSLASDELREATPSDDADKEYEETLWGQLEQLAQKYMEQSV